MVDFAQGEVESSIGRFKLNGLTRKRFLSPPSAVKISFSSAGLEPPA
jgi:hypothetical protein